MGTAFFTDAADFVQGERTTRVPYTVSPDRVIWTCPYCGDQRQHDVAGVNPGLGTVVGTVRCANGHAVTISAGATAREAAV